MPSAQDLFPCPSPGCVAPPGSGAAPSRTPPGRPGACAQRPGVETPRHWAQGVLLFVSNLVDFLKRRTSGFKSILDNKRTLAAVARIFSQRENGTPGLSLWGRQKVEAWLWSSRVEPSKCRNGVVLSVPDTRMFDSSS